MKYQDKKQTFFHMNTSVKDGLRKIGEHLQVKKIIVVVRVLLGPLKKFLKKLLALGVN